MSKKIKIDIPVELPTVTLEQLKKEYVLNDLKDKARETASLKKKIKQRGFWQPLQIWVEGKYVIDGTGRVQALDQLSYEGYEIPPIPYMPVSASNLREAKEKALELSAKWSNISKESFEQFAIDMPDIDLTNTPLDLNMDEIELGLPKPEKKERRKKEPGSTVMVHTCPKCGHEF